MKKNKILIAYSEDKKKEKDDIFSIFEDIKSELESWHIPFEESDVKERKRGYIAKIENKDFEITIAPMNDIIEMNEANTIYANVSEKKNLEKEKVKYFDYGLQILVDIVVEAKKEVEVNQKKIKETKRKKKETV